MLTMTARESLALLFVGTLAVTSLGANGCGPINPLPVDPTSAGGASGVGGAASAGTSGETPCGLACANLARLGCPEDQSSCVRLCELHATDSRFSQSISCRIAAQSVADAQACGPASCRR
jgi:hypothetical protein